MSRLYGVSVPERSGRGVGAVWFVAMVAAVAAEACLIMWGHHLAREYVHDRGRFRPTRAVIMTARLDTIEGDDDVPVRHLPVITYRYVADDRWKDGGRLLQGEAEHRAGKWAQKIMGRYPPGAQTTAYYDPNSPGDVFLVREPPAQIGILVAGGKAGLWNLGLYLLLRLILFPRSAVGGQLAWVLFWLHFVWRMGLFMHMWVLESCAALLVGLFSSGVAISRES